MSAAEGGVALSKFAVFAVDWGADLQWSRGERSLTSRVVLDPQFYNVHSEFVINYQLGGTLELVITTYLIPYDDCLMNLDLFIFYMHQFGQKHLELV